jgi:3',5'-cyclic AMP phosphodiesterase CpdA
MTQDRRISRREALRLGAGGLLVAGLWPGALHAEDAGAGGDFYFVAVNDTHYLDDHCHPWLEKAFRQMRSHAEKPEFCLLVGDLADQGKPAQLGPMRDFTAGLGMPVYAVVGNHDYLTQDDRKAYEELFPGRLNYRFEHRGWQFVGLDSSEGQHFINTRIQQPTLRWLDDNLSKLDRKRPMVLFTHFPLGPNTPSRPLNADDLLARFKEHNLQAVFNGHFHGFTERQVGPTTLTTNRCCSFSRTNHDGTKEKGYFLCQAKAGRVSRTFVEVKPG